jgi:hypothetical protein
VVAKFMEILAVRKQAAQKFYGGKFNLRKINDLGVIRRYQITISNRFAVLENLNDSENINRAWENIQEYIKIKANERLSLYRLQNHNPLFDEGCLTFLDQRIQDKMQW